MRRDFQPGMGDAATYPPYYGRGDDPRSESSREKAIEAAIEAQIEVIVQQAIDDPAELGRLVADGVDLTHAVAMIHGERMSYEVANAEVMSMIRRQDDIDAIRDAERAVREAWAQEMREDWTVKAKAEYAVKSEIATLEAE